MKVEYLNRVIITNKQMFDGMYYPNIKVIQISKTSIVLKVLTIFHELTHWVLDKVMDSSDIYSGFSDIIDKIQDKLPW